MVEDDFLKEKQNIREKMLKYSRAIKEGRPYEEYEQNFNESDRILKNRIQRKKRPKFTDFDEEYEEKPKKQSAIYLKEDLINVKLEEKKPFKLQLNFFKKQKEKFDKKNIANSKAINNKSIQEVKKIEKKQENKDSIQISKILTQSNVFVALKFQDLKKKRKEKSKLKQELKEQKKIEQEKIKKTQEELKEKEKLAKQEQKILEEKVRLEEENQEYNQEDKYELLDSIVSEENKNLSPKNLLYAGLMIAFALLIFFPQIYIRNQIYYVSRDIADLRSQELVLDEENKELKRQLEALYFQNQVLDFLD
ncbi:putative membrane protein [Campylobacter lari]|uniref:hypothetical protein n=1 Tax=Campylobacter lari TaxID=201 RepID=UPI0021538A6F|nr:hypothetical protein [Campylobacter lari]MCR6529911.1 hypothetical protein [Campylobacter lari]